MTRAARVMATATKRAMATGGDNRGNGYGKEGGGQATAATMAMGMGTAQRSQPLALWLERGGMMAAMGQGLCVCLCVCGETTKNKVGPPKSQGFLELIDHMRLAIDKLADNMVRSISDKLLVWGRWVWVGTTYDLAQKATWALCIFPRAWMTK